MQNFKSAGRMDNGSSQPGPSRLPSARELPEADNKTVELLSKFLLSNGIPLEASEDPTFKDLMTHLNSRRGIPTETAMSKFVAQGKTTKVNWHKISGPVSVTIDVEGRTEEKFLVISIHYFGSFHERKTVVYFRKLIPNVIEANNILRMVRMTVSHPAFTKLQFDHLVLPNSSLHSLFLDSHRDTKMSHVCFYHQMTLFVSKLLKNTSFVSLLGTLQVYMRKIRDDEGLCLKFRRFVATQEGASAELPVYEVGGWESCYVFLTQCIEMHDTFKTFHERFQGPTFLTSQAFSTLNYFQRLLHQCVRICCDLSHPDNTVSSIIPAIAQLREHISTDTPPQGESARTKNGLSSRVMKLVDSSFSEVLSGRNQVYYECATLLDPRFAYRDEFFDADKWAELENRVLSELDVKVFNQMAVEFTTYRAESFTHPPQPTESPLLWWAARLETLKHLGWEARDYLSCPAVSVDAGFFLGREGGKFSHLLKHHTDPSTQEVTLAMAAAQQKFQGKGGACKRIMDQTTSDDVRVLNRKSKKNLVRPDITDPHFNEINRNFDEEQKPQHLLNHEEPTIKQEPTESLTTTHMDTVVKIEVPEGFMSSGDFRPVKEESLEDYEESNGVDEESTVTQNSRPSSSETRKSVPKTTSRSGEEDPDIDPTTVKRECVTGLEQESSSPSWTPFVSPLTVPATLGSQKNVAPKAKRPRAGRGSQMAKSPTSPGEGQGSSQDVHRNGSSEMTEKAQSPVHPATVVRAETSPNSGSSRGSYPNGNSKTTEMNESTEATATVAKTPSTSDLKSGAVNSRAVSEDQDFDPPIEFSSGSSPTQFSPPNSVPRASGSGIEKDRDTTTVPPASVAFPVKTTSKLAGAGINCSRPTPKGPTTVFRASPGPRATRETTVSPTASIPSKSRIAGAGINCSRPVPDPKDSSKLSEPQEVDSPGTGGSRWLDDDFDLEPKNPSRRPQESARLPLNEPPKYLAYGRSVNRSNQPKPVTFLQKPLYYVYREAERQRTLVVRKKSPGEEITNGDGSAMEDKVVGRNGKKAAAAKKMEETNAPLEKGPRLADYMTRRRYSHFKCSICDLSASQYHVDKITDGPDKLTIMVAHIHQNMFTPQKGTWFMKSQNTYICEYHIHETVDTLYDILLINYPDDIVNANQEGLQHALEIVQGMQPTMKKEHVVEMFRKFLKDWSKFKPDREPIIHERPEPFSLPEEPPIAPKSQRQPRKQKLKEEDSPKKVVEQKSPNQERAACVYCSQTGFRNHMVPVPTLSERRAQWIGKLGAGFKDQLEESKGDLFICKTHFVFGAFLQSGELKDEALPFSMHVENAYEIVDGRMIKLEEPDDPNAVLVDLTEDDDEDWDQPSTSDGRRGEKRRGDDEDGPAGKQMKF